MLLKSLKILRAIPVYSLRGAKALIGPLRDAMPTLDTVQCLLVLCQYTQGTQDPLGTLELHGQGKRLALQLVLHAPSSWTRSDLLEGEVWKRTWASCVMMDRVLSAAFGRPVLVSECCGRIDPPLQHDLDLSSDETLRGLSTVCCFAGTGTLYEILGRVLTTKYDDNGDVSTPQSLARVIQHSLAIEETLQAWEDGLPLHLKLTPWTDDFTLGDVHPVFARLSTVIHLRALNVWMLKDRALLDGMLRMHTHDDAQSSRVLDMAATSVRNLQNSAFETVSIVSKMSGRTGTLGAWFSASYVLCASLILFGCCLLEVRRISKIQAQRNLEDFAGFDEITCSLRRGREAVQTLVKDSGRLCRLRATLERLLQTAESFREMIRRGGSNDESRNHGDDTVDAVAMQAGQEGYSSVPPTGLYRPEQSIEWQDILGADVNAFAVLNLNDVVYNLNEFITM